MIPMPAASRRTCTNKAQSVPPGRSRRPPLQHIGDDYIRHECRLLEAPPGELDSGRRVVERCDCAAGSRQGGDLMT
jgi:hypothetical protein